MDSSAKIIKANGIIHIIHGAIIGLIMLLLALFILSEGVVPGLLLVIFIVGLPLVYIYIGYELTALRDENKTKKLLIASIVLSGVEVAYSLFQGEVAGTLFLLEFILSIISIAGIESYKNYRNKQLKG